MAKTSTAPSRSIIEWFVPFCKKHHVEPCIVDASLRLQESNAIDTEAIDKPTRATKKLLVRSLKKHLLVCLRIMVKFLDDNVMYGGDDKSYLKNINAKAGFKHWQVTDDEWTQLEMDLCQKVQWNLRQFCKSDKNFRTDTR